MAQNFNGFNGIPHHGDAENGFDLTNSLITFPGTVPFSPFPPLPPLWPTAPGWQPGVQAPYNPVNQFQGVNLTNSNGYFTTQQDFVAFDEGDDFYNNEDEDTPMNGNETRTVVQDVSHNHQGLQNDSAEHSGIRTPSAKHQDPAQSLPRADVREQSTPNATTPNAAKAQLDALRAKLLSQKRVGGKTPTPELSTQLQNRTRDQVSTGNKPTEQSGRLRVDGALAKDEFDSRTELVKSTLSGINKEDAKSTTISNFTAMTDASAPRQTYTSSEDIEMLLAEARDNTVGKGDKRQPELADLDSHKGSNTNQTHEIQPRQGELNHGLTSATTSVGVHKNLHGSKASSDSSEMGEIREDPKPAARLQTKPSPPEPVLSKDFRAPPKPSNHRVPEAPPRTANSASKQQPAKIDTSLANKQRNGSGVASGKVISPIPSSTRTPSTAVARTSRDYPTMSDHNDQGDRYNRIKDRFAEAAWIAPELREEPRPVRAQTFRPTYPSRQDIIDENERRAAEYKSRLQQSRVPDRDIASADTSSQTPKTSPKTTLPSEGAEYFADVDEWLEMTGYHDTTYRKKALNRHRKLVQLDRERVQLEREAQIEHEEQSQRVRAQSVNPSDGSIPLRSAITTKAFVNFTMPPPPTPSKDINDDMGIQIKDLAQRNTSTTIQRTDNATLVMHDSPTSLTPTVKRQRSGDDCEPRGGRLLDKIPRTNGKEFSPERKIPPRSTSAKTGPPAASLESRISVDNNVTKREYRQRSRSLEDKRRSASPPARRASGPDVRAGRRTEYSPNRRATLSRDVSPNHSYGALPYDDIYDGGHRRYESVRFDYDSRQNYDSYPGHPRGTYQQYIPSGSRGRGRGRGRGGNSSDRGLSY